MGRGSNTLLPVRVQPLLNLYPSFSRGTAILKIPPRAEHCSPFLGHTQLAHQEESGLRAGRGIWLWGWRPRPMPSPPPCIDQAHVPMGARAQHRSRKARAEGADVSGAARRAFGQGVEGCLRGSMASGQGRGGCGRCFSDAEPGFRAAGSALGTS